MHYHGLGVMAKYQTPITMRDFMDTAKQDPTVTRSRLFGDRFDHWVDINGVDQWDLTQSDISLMISGTSDPSVCALLVFGTENTLLDEYTGTPAGIVATILDGWAKWINRNGLTPAPAPADDTGRDVEKRSNSPDTGTARDNS